MIYRLTADLEALLAALAAQAALYLPVTNDGRCDFAPWQAGASYAPQTLLPVSSLKNFFFPPSETFARFATAQGGFAVEPLRAAPAPLILFGARACDAAALTVLDAVFLAEPADDFYAARRAQTTVITLACNEPHESCFCGAFGVDAAAPGGDVACWQIGDDWYWQPCTERGLALTEALSALLQAADAAAAESKLAEAQTRIRARLAAQPLADLQLGFFATKPEAVWFDAPHWQELSQACLGYGLCTFVCPTCHCYDVRDFPASSGISRFRCWDSCMYAEFTNMAHGNPRTTQRERYRQRFLHKLVYYPANHAGRMACVGCGRCVRHCPVGTHIAKVAATLGGAADA